MEHTMAVSLRESLQLVSDPQNLDGSVDEVFQMMLGVTCERVSGPRAEEPGVGYRGCGIWRRI